MLPQRSPTTRPVPTPSRAGQPLVDRIEGDYYTIMGLPVSRTVQLVERFV